MTILRSLLLVGVLLLAACGDDGVDGEDTGTSAGGTTAGDPDPDPALDPGGAVMAAALEQLVTVDHTFGSGPPPFTEYLVQAHLDPAAGTGSGGSAPGRALTEAEQAAVTAALEPLGPVRWIDDPDEFRTDDLRPTIEGAVILGVGEPEIDGDQALVPVSLWCGGLCGTWFTYRIELVDGDWLVAGTEGPIAIS